MASTKTKIEKTFKFFDMAAIQSLQEHSEDVAHILEADDVELIEDKDGVRLVCQFTRYAMDSNGHHVGYEGCTVTFKAFDASEITYINPQKLEVWSMHKLGITLDLHDAPFEIEPARKEIPWEEIFLDNHPEYADHLQTYKESESVDEPIDEDFCAYLSDREIHIVRENYFDAYSPADEEFWFQELEQRFDKLKDELRRTHWKFIPNAEELEQEPWQMETESKQSSLTR